MILVPTSSIQGCVLKLCDEILVTGWYISMIFLTSRGLDAKIKTKTLASVDTAKIQTGLIPTANGKSDLRNIRMALDGSKNHVPELQYKSK